MSLQLAFPLDTTVRTRHTSQQTLQEGTIVGYWEAQDGGLYVRFDGAEYAYSFPASYVRDPLCLTRLRRGAGQ